MIVMIGRAKVKSEKRAIAVLTALEMAEAARAAAGCLSYQLFTELTDPEALFILEEWESPAALDRHQRAERTVALSQKFAQYLAAELETKRYEVSDAGAV